MTEPEKPKLVSKVLNFVKEEAVWIFHGRPFRPVEDINHIYYKLCRKCKYHVKDQCKICGCRMVRMELSPLNKLAMATTSCPHPDGPMWVSEITPPEGISPEQYQAAVERSHTMRVEEIDNRFAAAEDSEDKKKEEHPDEQVDVEVATDGVSVKKLSNGQIVEGN